jgi:hypothetical protein
MCMDKFNIHTIYKPQIDNMDMKLIHTNYFSKIYYVLTF